MLNNSSLLKFSLVITFIFLFKSEKTKHHQFGNTSQSNINHGLRIVCINFLLI